MEELTEAEKAHLAVRLSLYWFPLKVPMCYTTFVPTPMFEEFSHLYY